MDSKRKQQLMQRTRQENNCLIWTGSLDKLGYGHTTLNGKSMYTHRVSYILHIGDIPKGLQVDHLCNNKSCINPDHLEAVTPKENLRRAGNFNHNTKKLRCPLGHTYTIEYLKNGRNHRICTICRRYRWYLKDQRLASSSFSKSELDKRINLFMTLQETEQCVQPEISEFCTKCEKRFGSGNYKAAIKLELFRNGINVYGKHVVQAQRYLETQSLDLQGIFNYYGFEITRTRLFKK